MMQSLPQQPQVSHSYRLKNSLFIILELHELPYFTKFILCAAYLASYNPPRQDRIYFMKFSDRKSRKRGGGGVHGRMGKHRKVCLRQSHWNDANSLICF